MLKDLKFLSKMYEIPSIDIILMDLNISGVSSDIDADRVRFNLRLLNGKENYYCALQLRRDSDYRISEDKLYFKNEHIGWVNNFEIDFCDSYYMRRNNTVLNINPKTRLNCEGCKFCYTSHQKSRSIIDLTIPKNLDNFFYDWMNLYGKNDLSGLYQIAVVSGCFPNENSLVKFLLDLNDKVEKMNFHGEIFYLGSQIQTEESLKKLSEIPYFAYSLSIECFENRDKLLRKSKSGFTLEQIKRIMQLSILYGHRTNFTYIVGLDGIKALEEGLKNFEKYINSFPIFNILQEHEYQKGLRNYTANNIQYYLQARKTIEKIFAHSSLKPTMWEVCRTLWYTSYNGEKL